MTFLSRISKLINIGAEQPTLTRVKRRTSCKTVLGKYGRLNVCFFPIYGHNVIRPAVWQTAVMCEQ